MEQLKALRTFVAVAEHASFAEAARRLGLSPTTVTRTIASLEASLGILLLVRTTRSVRLTDDGTSFLEKCRAGLAEIDEAFSTARGGNISPRGTLTITAPVMFGRRHVVPIVTDLLRKYPDLNIRLLLLDRVVRLVEEGIDIAVRIADLPDSALHMLRIGEVRRVLSASPDYLRDRGVPTQTSHLRHHDLITIEDEIGPSRGSGAVEGRRQGNALRLSVNSMEAAIDAAVAGLGIVPSLSYQVADHIAAGKLTPVLVSSSEPSVPVSLLFQSGRRNSANVRAFVEAAHARFLDEARLTPRLT